MPPKPALEPLVRLRAAVPVCFHPTLNLLLGTVTQPADQPDCVTAVITLINCLLLYCKQIPAIRTDFEKLLEDARGILTSINEQARSIQGNQPAGQMVKRVSEYPGWSLLLLMPDEALPLRQALGVEIAIALLDRIQINKNYCTALRKDLNKYGRPQGEIERQPSDLAKLKFARAWIFRYERVDKEVRARIGQPDPDESPNSGPKSVHDLIASLRARHQFPNPKHRQGTQDDSHLTTEQYARVALAIRSQVDSGQSEGVVAALVLLNRLTPELTLLVPLITRQAVLHGFGLDVEHGSIVLDLRAIFPNRRIPTTDTAALFEKSGDELTIPLPMFLAAELQRRLEQFRDAVVLGDLVNWIEISNTESVLDGEHCKLHSSLARTGKTTAAIAISKGVNRLVAACLTFDFSLIGAARMYYARLEGREIYEGACMLYSNMGWGEPALNAATIPSAGSLCTLTNAGTSQIFSYLASQCSENRPGRRAGLQTLITHHQHYIRYVAALVSFSLGLRSITNYKLFSADLVSGQNQLVINDKHGGDHLMAQPVRINSLVLEQIHQFIVHSRALIKRLGQFDTVMSQKLQENFEEALLTGLLFQFISSSGGLQPAGSDNVWGVLPKNLKVPSNVSRHFWQNALRHEGLGSRDIDRFMRHRVLGLENNSSSQVSSPRRSLDRINIAQVTVLTRLGIDVIIGLRKG